MHLGNGSPVPSTREGEERVQLKRDCVYMYGSRLELGSMVQGTAKVKVTPTLMRRVQHEVA
jgi:hypothetical protein